ncbi:MAG: hypothetical protein ABI193_19015 [Minicystis sp.]
MNLKIDRDELPEIVEETARLEEEDQALLETKEAKQILRELDLPDTRVDEVRKVIAERKVERAQQTKVRIIGVVVGVVALIGAGALALRTAAQRQALGQLAVAEAALKLGSAPLPASLPRAASPEIALDLVLENAPQGSALPLRCEWSGPDGSMRYQNSWETKSIDRARWPTHCKHTFGGGDAAGRWSVTMKQGERALATESFVLD